MSNSNNAQNLLSEQSQVWLEAVLKHTRYCYYFAVVMGNNEHPVGSWNAPFYSIEEAQQFKEAIQAKHPDSEFFCIEGMLHIDLAMKNTPNKFWAIWQNKHKQRLEELNANKKAVTL